MKKCENCNSVHDGSFGSGRFCCKKCSKSFSTKNKRKDINNKVSKALKSTSSQIFYNKCEVCEKIFIVNKKKRYKKCCSKNCANTIVGKKRGLLSVKSQQRRSKNEIHFANLCKQHFKEVKCNEPIFNGWDADVIIEDYKIAILWNGPWHYKQIGKDHNLKQVQNRDKIKLKEIEKCGYESYIVKDMGKENSDFVEKEFKKFKIYVKKSAEVDNNILS